MDYNSKLNTLIEAVIREQGSDLHIGSGRIPMMRVVGSLVQIVNQEPLTQIEVIEMIKIMVQSETKVDHFMSEQELDFAYDYKQGVRLRGNAYFERGDISVALRLIPQVKSLTELNLPEALILHNYSILF